MSDAGVTETQLVACLGALDTAAEPSSVALATRALVGSGVDDLVGTLGLIEQMGYLRCERNPAGSIVALELTGEGRRLLTALRSLHPH